MPSKHAPCPRIIFLLIDHSVGSGSVSIPDYAQHPMLGKPIADDPIRSGPIYEASWTHALHCVGPQRFPR